jgi:hypothetical protein
VKTIADVLRALHENKLPGHGARRRVEGRSARRGGPHTHRHGAGGSAYAPPSATGSGTPSRPWRRDRDAEARQDPVRRYKVLFVAVALLLAVVVALLR